MPRIAAAKEREPWKHDGRWASHSIGVWEHEWTEWKELAQLAGKSTNGWLRDAANEVARLERMELREKADRGDGTPSKNIAENQNKAGLAP